MTVKVVIIGDAKVGKTSLSMRYADQAFQYEYIKTIGTNFFMKNISLNGEEITLVLWDLAGDESFGLLRPLFYQGAFGALLVFDVTQRSSFEHLEDWLKELRENVPQEVPTVLACNKIDLVKEEWEVREPEIHAFTETRELPFFMTSAKTNENVEPAVLKLVEDIGASLKEFYPSKK